VSGRLQRANDVIHVVAERFIDLSGRLVELKSEGALEPYQRVTQERLQRSRDFH